MFKSIKTSVIALILISTAIYARAQKKINSGVITYGIEYALTDEQKPTIDVSMLPTENLMEFNGNLSKLPMDYGPVIITIVKDGSHDQALLLIDVPMQQQQIAAKMTKEDMEKQSGNIKYLDFKATGEKQTISGYNTEKYTYKDNKGAAYELWATKDLQLPAGAHDSAFKDLKGTPVKFSVNQNSIKTTFTIKKVQEKTVGPFTLDVPKGYTIKTMAELEAMRGGG